MITVMNIKDVPAKELRPHMYYFYVGRNRYNAEKYDLLSVCTLGNPFYIGNDGSRTNVIEKYRTYFKEEMLNNTTFTGIVNLLASIASKTDTVLVCHCAPLACHADVIKEEIEALLKK